MTVYMTVYMTAVKARMTAGTACMTLMLNPDHRSWYPHVHPVRRVRPLLEPAALRAARGGGGSLGVRRGQVPGQHGGDGHQAWEINKVSNNDFVMSSIPNFPLSSMIIP